MRPAACSTRSSPPSPHAAERPRPTLADVEIAPRRRLRDGSTSSRGSRSSGSSRGSSVASSSSRAAAAAAAGAGAGVRGRGSSVRRTIPSSAAARGASNARSRPSRASATVDRDEVEESSTSSTSDDVVAISDEESAFVPSRESSLSRLSPIAQERRAAPQTRQPHLQPARSILDEMYDNADDLDPLSRLSTPPAAPRPAHVPYTLTAADFGAPSTASSSTSTSGSPVEMDPSSARRYTTQEKGKGRAVVPSPIEVEDEADDSVQIVKAVPKRKRSLSSSEVEAVVPIDGAGEEGVDEESSLGGGYACPICFCPPTQAVITQCGHIMCAQCLHSSLTAAIGRNPNPFPPTRTANRGRGRGAGAGARGGRRGAAARGAAVAAAQSYGPTDWTKELLQDAWRHHLVEESEKQLARGNVPKEEWNAIHDAMIPEPEALGVEEVLKGLWRIENSNWVVEGECPVCRNALPGGYGPPNTGIGGIIPLVIKVSAKVKSKRR